MFFVASKVFWMFLSPIAVLLVLALVCEFRFNPARDSDLMSAAVPI